MTNAKMEKKVPKGLQQRSSMDITYLLLVLLIFTFGLIMMFSASYASAYFTEDNATHFFTKQGAIGLAGIVVMLIVSRLNNQQFRLLTFLALPVAIIFLVLVLFIGRTAGGAKRWIDIYSMGFQPSEIAKVAVIMSFALMISTFREKMKTFRYGILPFVSILATFSILMLLQPHISGTVLLVLVGAAMMFVGGVHWGWFTAAIGVGAGLVIFVMTTMAHSSSRIQIWQDPFSDPQGVGYQTIQSLYAVGSGGLFGVGLGKSRQKYLYLPEQHNDFVFAVVCEELGMIGACIVIFLFVLLILRGYWIALHSRDRFGGLLVTGITTLLAFQVFLNIAVVTNFIPVTGISLPFFSYGGTSLLLQLIQMGMVLSVSRQTKIPKA